MSNRPADRQEPDEAFGATIISLTSEDGEEIELEYLDTIEYNNQIYMAFFPTIPEDVDPETVEDNEEYGLILMRVVQVDGEEQLVTLDNEAEAEAVYEKFMEALFEDEEE